jgi:hypothetical protein
MISKIENLSHMKKLKNLDLRNNIIGANGVNDLKDLLNMEKIEILNLTGNKI